MPVPKSVPVVNPPKQTTDRYLLVESVEGRDELFKQGVSAIEALERRRPVSLEVRQHAA